MYFSTGIPEVLCCPDFTEVSMELPSCCDASKACVGTCWRSCCASSRLGKRSKSEGWWVDGDVDHKLWHVKFGKNMENWGQTIVEVGVAVAFAPMPDLEKPQTCFIQWFEQNFPYQKDLWIYFIFCTMWRITCQFRMNTLAKNLNI